MTKRFLSAAILLFVALTGLRAQLNWQLSNAPDGCRVIDFAQDSTGVLWATIDQSTTGRQIIRSTDDGQTWTAANLPYFEDKSVKDIEVGPNGYLYFNDFEGTLYRSTDGGATWTDHPIASYPCYNGSKRPSL